MQRFQIEVELVDNNMLGSHMEQLEPGKYKVVVSRKQVEDNDLDPMVVAAHELGHILGYEFETPVHRETREAWWSHLSPSMTLAKENEAWDIAEVVLKVRKWAIGNYESFYKKALTSFTVSE